jgi:uncharacterized protein YbjT (DUF2867 family)
MAESRPQRTPQRIAIAGGTGTVGRFVTELVRAHGHEPVVLSRSTGVDLVAGDGLQAVLRGVDTLIDVSGPATMSAAASIRGFQAITGNLLRAEQAAGVRHHIALSIVGIDTVEKGYGYYQGKQAQERLVMAGPVPWTILRATQFHEFARQMFTRAKLGPFVLVPTMRSQPIAASEVAARLVELAEGAPQGRVGDLAGPRVERMADLARRYGRAAGVPGRVVELSMPGRGGTQMRNGSLLAPVDAQIAGPDFTTWLIEQTGSDGIVQASQAHRIAGISIVREPLPTPPEPSLTNARELIAGLQRAGMPISLTIEGEPRPLAPTIDAAAFEALQEGAALVLTRTRGVDATACVRYLSGAVEVEVTHGPARLTAPGRVVAGLDRSRSEVRRLGGATSVDARDDGAFRVTATIPTPQ